MLQDISTLPNETEEQKNLLFDFWMRGVVAYDAETEAELFSSNAHRRTGRPRHYYVWAPNGQTIVRLLRAGWQRCKQQSRVFGLSAYTTGEAIERANRLFSRKFAKFKETEYRQETLEEITQQVQMVAAQSAEKRYDPHWMKKMHPSVLSTTLLQACETEPNSAYCGGTWQIRLCYERQNVCITIEDREEKLAVLNWEEETNVQQE